jgi:hypothetical protein
MKVYLDDVIQGTGYTVTLNADQNANPGGDVTFSVAPVTDAVITLLREVPLDQLVDYNPYDPFPAETHERALDKLTQICQQLDEKVNRAITTPPSEDEGYEFPSYEARYLVGWDENEENKLVNYPNVLDGIGATANTEEQTATAGQTVFTLTTPYFPGIGNLNVYVNGVRQYPGSYTETNSTTVTFSSGLDEGDVVLFVIGEIITTVGGDAKNVSYTPAGTGAVPTTVQAKLRESVSVLDYGADPTGVLDSTSAIQAALDSGAKTVVIPSGTYKVISTLNINTDRLHLVGDGLGSTLIDFEPTGNSSCLKVEKGQDVIFQGSIKNIGFFSYDTTYTKTCIELIDHSGYIVENCGTQFPHVKGNGSIFLHIKGREFGNISNIYAQADRPILCDPIPAPHTAAGIGLDHHNFHNVYVIAGDYPCVEFGDGLLMTQCSFTGAQAWVGGTHGFYWNDTTSSGVSNGLIFDSVRFEQGVANTNWLLYIQHNTNLFNLVIRGGQGGDRNGFYLRNCQNVTLDNFTYTSASLIAMNIDSSVKQVASYNCFWQAGSTAVVSGQRNIFSIPKNPNTGALPPTFIYDESANAEVDIKFGGRLDVDYGQLKFPSTANPSTDVNTLDDYKEGVFTPTWTPASGSGQTISLALGWYTKIGNRVFIDITLATNGLGTASGDITIGNLPYTSSANANQFGGVQVVQAVNANITAGYSAGCIVNYNSTSMTPLLWDSTGGTSSLQVSEWGASGLWRFTGSYQVA